MTLMHARKIPQSKAKHTKDEYRKCNFYFVNQQHDIDVAAAAAAADADRS